MSDFLANNHFSSEECVHMEHEHSAHNYHPLPVVFEKAEGCVVTDPEGKKYYDFLSAYSAVNQGHCHPKIIKALCDQAQKLTLSSRAFHNSVFGPWSQFVTDFFGYECVLPMNTGAEAVETGLKMARRWGYMKKGIPENEAIIVCCKENFHGRTLAIISMSTDPDSYGKFGPFLPGIIQIDYNSMDQLKEVLEKHGDKVCCFLVEPIQGEAGVVVPDEGYLKGCYELCKKHNVLMICDEIQTGIARTGKMLCHEWDGFKADAVLLGKALSGGVLPVSCVLSSKEIMSVFNPGSHGSTYGGNPLSCAVSLAALEVIRDEKLTEKANEMGEYFRKELSTLVTPGGAVTKVRGRGLLNAVVLDLSKTKFNDAYEICKLMKEKGLLAKQTHKCIIRFAPPLVITKEQLDDCLKIIKSVLGSL